MTKKSIKKKINKKKKGFTFKDNAGYGMYPTSQDKIESKSNSQIKTGLDLKRPESGLYTNIVTKDKWTGFNIKEDTQLVVLESEREGNIGDGVETCTLCQKGDNYTDVEKEKKKKPRLLTSLIKKHNTIISTSPNLTTSSTSNENGLYMSTLTNSKNPTYYFRGNITNNYMSFANLTWRIVRINEDGTIRLILQNGIKNKFNTINNVYHYMYYSNSDTVKPILNNWYTNNLLEYDSYIVEGEFCEQAKVKIRDVYTSGETTMELTTSYIPNFKCSMDGNEKGIIKNKIGMITVDEEIYAGGYFGFGSPNSSYYLNIGTDWWTMSPGGLYEVNEIWAIVWYVAYNGGVDNHHVANEHNVRPVINLDSNVKVTGTGTKTDPYVVIAE